MNHQKISSLARLFSLLSVTSLLILQGCGASSSSKPTSENTQQATSAPKTPTNAFQVYFTTPSLIYPDKTNQRTIPPYEKALLTDLDKAQKSIDLATFEYNLTSVADALARAKKRGVTVRLALDKENLEKPEMAQWAGVVEKANIPIAWEETTAFLHSKYVIIDQTVVWMGSWNVTNNDTYRNNNNLLRITIPKIVANYAAEFSQMTQSKFGKSKKPLAPNPVVEANGIHFENYFSPQDGIEKHILERLKKAQKSVRFLAFSFTSDEIANEMIARKKAGVDVEGVFESRNASGTGADFALLKQAGVAVLKDGNCYTMHHKVIIIDDKTVITGSYNFTKRAEENNDENLLIIDDPVTARLFTEEFKRVYEQARQPTRCGG